MNADQEKAVRPGFLFPQLFICVHLPVYGNYEPAASDYEGAARIQAVATRVQGV